MSGLVGLITRLPPLRARAEVLKMLGAVVSVPLSVRGIWENADLGLYIGWAEQAHVAQVPERNDLLLAWCGEEFSELGMHQRFLGYAGESGISAATWSREEPTAFPASLNGRFHGILADARQGRAILFNDRYGMQRCYYSQGPNGFYFASEAKAILAVRPELRSINSRSLGEFVSCGAVLENRTLFEGIQLLPPASAWSFRNRELDKRLSYFDPREWEEQETLAPDLCYRELRAAFTQNLRRYFSGNQRVGMSLTGGLDTRMILANYQPEPGALPCYTFGSMFRENQDVRVARRVAQICQQPHEVITAGAHFLANFAEYANRSIYLTDGCVDVSRTPDLYLNEKIRQIAPVRMTGVFGGEILRGIVAFKPVDLTPNLFSAGTVSSIGEAARTYAESRNCHPVTFSAFRQAPWYMSGIMTLEQTQVTMRTPFLDNAFVRSVFRFPSADLGNIEISRRLIADGNPALLRIPTDRGLIGDRGAIAGALSRGLLEFLFKAEYAYDMGMPQWLARSDHSLRALQLQRLFLGRHKTFHFRVWYRDQLAPYVRGLLLDPLSLSRPWIERKTLERVVEGHLTGVRNYTTELHKLLSLELVGRLLIDRPIPVQDPEVAAGSQPMLVPV